MASWDWRLTFYYVEDPELLVKVRRGKVPPTQAGKLAIQTVHAGDASKLMELSASKHRRDLGRVVVERNASKVYAGGEVWIEQETLVHNDNFDWVPQ